MFSQLILTWRKVKSALGFEQHHRVTIHFKSGNTLTLVLAAYKVARKPDAPNEVAALEWTFPKRTFGRNKITFIDPTQIEAITSVAV